jgi:hypothetical protein
MREPVWEVIADDISAWLDSIARVDHKAAG